MQRPSQCIAARVWSILHSGCRLFGVLLLYSGETDLLEEVSQSQSPVGSLPRGTDPVTWYLEKDLQSKLWYR